MIVAEKVNTVFGATVGLEIVVAVHVDSVETDMSVRLTDSEEYTVV